MKKKATKAVVIACASLMAISTTPSTNVFAYQQDGSCQAEEMTYSLSAKEVAAGYAHSAVLTEEGEVWCFGRNDFGQIGNGTTTRSATPQKAKVNVKFTSVTAGKNHTVAIDENGMIWAWGDNQYGQVGNKSTKNTLSPVCITKDIDAKFIQVVSSSNADYTLALDELGNVWAWGQGMYGTFGNGYTTSSNIPVQTTKDKKFVKLAAGHYHAAAIDQSGNIWTWGTNMKENKKDGGFLGTADFKNYYSPVQISTGIEYSDISADEMSTVATDSLGNVWTWGSNKNYLLADGSTKDANAPQQLDLTIKYADVEVGFINGAALDKEGVVYTWGVNSTYGALGNGTTDKADTDSKLTAISGFDAKITDIAVGATHTLAIDEIGNVYAWGGGISGNIGNGEKTAANPTPVMISQGAVAVKIDGVKDGWTTSEELTAVVSTKKEDAKVTYSWDDGKTWVDETKLTVDKNGTVSCKAKDENGYISTYMIDIANIDTEAPVINSVIENSTSNDMWQAEANITVKAQDVGSGIVGYSLDGKEYQTGSMFPVKANGEYTVYVKDACDNVSTAAITIKDVDNEGPVIDSIEPSSTEKVAKLTLTVTAHDDVSGIANLGYSFDAGKTWAVSSTATITENGTYKIMVKDNAGNTSEKEIEISNVDPLMDATSSYDIDSSSSTTTESTDLNGKVTSVNGTTTTSNVNSGSSGSQIITTTTTGSALNTGAKGGSDVYRVTARTGDEMNMPLVLGIVLSLVVLVGAGVSFFFVRKKNQAGNK